MSGIDHNHINTGVKLTEGPGQPALKPGGVGTLKSLLGRIQGLPVPDDDPRRGLLATNKANGYRVNVNFLAGEACDLEVYTSGGVLNSELATWLKGATHTHDFNPLLFRKRARLMCEAVANFNGGEVGHMGMPTALKMLRACQRHGVAPEQAGLTFCLKVFAISSLGPIGPYQFYSKEFELEQARVLTGMTRKADGKIEWPALQPVEGIPFRVASDGRIFDGDDEPVSTTETFARYLMDRRAGDGEGFVVYAHSSRDVAGGPLFTSPDAHGKLRSRTFSKVLRQFQGVLAARPEDNGNGDLALALYTTMQPGSKELTRVGSMPRPPNCPGISADQVALYRLRFTWVYPNGSVAGVNVAWDNPSPDIVAGSRAHELVTPVSQIIANHPHREAIWGRNRTLAEDVQARLNRLLAEKEDAKNSPAIRTTAQIIQSGQNLSQHRIPSFLAADSHTMLLVQAARAAKQNRQPLSDERTVLATHLSLHGPSNCPQDGQAYLDTVALTTQSEWTHKTYTDYCSRYGNRKFEILSVQWLVDSIKADVYQPIGKYSVVLPPAPKPARQAPAPSVESAKRARVDPAPVAPAPSLFVRCITNGLPPVSQQTCRDSSPEDA